MGVAQVRGRGLQSVEKQACGFVFDVSGEEEVQHLHDGDLDGVGVLEYGKVDGRHGFCCSRKQ